MIIGNFDFNWFSYFRIKEMDEEAAQLMKDSGCKGVFLGLESNDDQILKNMNKNATDKDYKKGLELLHKYSIPAFACFLLGFPGESPQSVKKLSIY
jgi:anaerobic magnesium-protoporphyrin IX monomethyl ester cyclase